MCGRRFGSSKSASTLPTCTALTGGSSHARRAPAAVGAMWFAATCQDRLSSVRVPTGCCLK
ncbi:hypothetical protein QJS04_geneDACA019603 [Acorus gramineus]|uniref:Uncharacterized protein n=1 Tax=Acorus gramineus TaxID=55184 RepID=A0AAV8ZX90_ACOGR|nr:hypothetical protein QJS04_geneDACA019603 [Acorus gramineus]